MLTVLVKLCIHLRGIVEQTDTDATLGVKLGHTYGGLEGTLLISHEYLWQMINSVGMLEFLGSGGTHRGLLEAHLGFLFFQIQESLLDLRAAVCDTKIS